MIRTAQSAARAGFASLGARVLLRQVSARAGVLQQLTTPPACHARPEEAQLLLC
jgi:hypothetical protein